jgi:rfaE bifunctional protein kinase chain/domain
MTQSLPSRARLSGILDSLSSVRAAVVGDFAVDAYWHADMMQSELSRETAQPTRPIVRERYTPGGASNVCWNFVTLGVEAVQAVTVVGQDWRWEILRSLLTDIGVDVDHVVSSSDWATTMFAKPILSAYGLLREDARLDFISDRTLSPDVEEAFLARVKSVLPQVDVVTVTDQVSPGVLTEHGIAALTALAQDHPEVIFVADSRYRVDTFHHMVLKPNNLEAAQALFPHKAPEAVTREELMTAAPDLRRIVGRPVYITLGGEGVLICDETEVRYTPSVSLSPPIDVVGAGDAFLATLAASLAAGASHWEAGVLANLAAAVVCKKLNTTGTASPEEILAVHDQLAR